MIHYLISHLERSTLNLNIRVGEWFSHQSAKLKREIFNEGSNPSTDSNFKFKNMAYIYCITNLINSKRYVGKTTTSIEERWKEHCYDFQKERCNKRPLYDAMNKYGIQNFIVEQIYECDNEELSSYEIQFIDKLGTYSNGYNATKGGDGTVLFDYKEIISLYENGLSMIEVSRKIQCSVDTVSKVINLNNIPKNKFYLGSCKQPIQVAQYDLNNNFLKNWNSIADAAHWLVDNGYAKTYNGGVRQKISLCVKGKLKTAYKFIWK